jgi:hypothetical protein
MVHPEIRLFSKLEKRGILDRILLMNSFNQTAFGLASSLFLAAGLTRLAEKADPMLKQNQAALTKVQDASSSAWTDWPCNFTPQTGQ